ncbi:sigma-70 family RNA polymerase sigma factor [Paenibacillus ginsengarvi]|uniref:sigma-70 family RNA polymerase sigma factor n=1 Tax=Paenibacillus ginsengarvi TaxID=400777 RepID=UPI001315431E|nr:sigma-70 family RNA polymerase sigma factor [Paenibacillus ginsengarvi]
MTHADTDGLLVERVLKGDKSAYSELIGIYMNVLYALGYRMTGDFHYAQDIAQEALIKAYFRLSELKEKDKFGSWLYAIALRTAQDFQRKIGREIPGPQLAAERIDPFTTEDRAEANELREHVREAFGELPELYRETAMLHLIAGLPAPRIAKLLGQSVSATESRLRRAKRLLREMLRPAADAYLSVQRLGDDFRQRVIMLLLQRLNCFYLPVRDPYRSALWYQEHFGLEAGRPPEERASGISLSVGSRMELYLLRWSPAQPLPVKPFELLAFEVDDLITIAARLRAGGVQVDGIVTEADHIRCRFADPDGHFFVLRQQTG